MSPAAIWAALSSKIGRWAAGAAAAAVLIWRFVVAIRQGAQDEVRAEAAANEQRTRRRADAAAAAAERDGASERLRSGTF